MVLQVKPDGGVPAFQPGQYVALGLPGSAPRYEGALEELAVPAADKLIKRAYSIGSSPTTADFFEFYIAIVPNGALTSRLAVVKPGDRIFSQPKVTGTFTLDGVPHDHNLVLVSTGTGLAPFMSMVRTPSVWTPGRYPQDFAYAEELLSFSSANPGVTYLPIASRADESFTGRKGRVQALFEDGSIQLSPETDHVFLCGNPAMIDDLERDLTTKLGYVVHSKKTPGNLHVEKYW
jgi:ferredoxin--NADP+ reductase